MTDQDYKVRYDRLLNLVFKMRGYQRSWIKYHLSGDREKAKRYENEVDKMIESEAQRKDTKQSEIF